MSKLMTVDGVAAIFLAPFFGSFLGVVIDRLPAGRPVLTGRSTCDHCGEKLGALELIPLISYMLQGGRCRRCGAALRMSYPLIELGALAVALGAAALVSGWLLLASLYLGWSLLALAVIDARHRILPDPINLPLIPAGLLATHVLMPDRLDAHLIGALVGFIALAAIAYIYRRLRDREGLGLGDAKLYAAAGAWLGVEALPGVMLVAALSALTVALARTAVGVRLNAGSEIAFGPYLAMAFWMSWLFGPLVLT